MLKRATRGKGGRRSIQDQMLLPMPESYVPPVPPDDMTGPEQYVWRNLVEQCPRGWFTPDVYPILQRLCFVMVWIKRLEVTFNTNGNRFDDGGVEYGRANALMLTIARQLRLTLKSRKLKAGRAARLIKDHVAKTETTWDDSEEKDRRQAA